MDSELKVRKIKCNFTERFIYQNVKNDTSVWNNRNCQCGQNNFV